MPPSPLYHERTDPRQPPPNADSDPASCGTVLTLAVSARRFAVATFTLSAVVYLLAWFSSMDHLVTGLMLLGGLSAGVWLVRRLVWLLLVAAMATTIGALVGLQTLGTLNGAGILATGCAVAAALTAVLAWMATAGFPNWLPPTSFPWRQGRSRVRPVRLAPTGIRVPGRHAAPSHHETGPAPAESPHTALHPEPRPPIPPSSHVRPGPVRPSPADAPTEITTWSSPPGGHPPPEPPPRASSYEAAAGTTDRRR